MIAELIAAVFMLPFMLVAFVAGFLWYHILMGFGAGVTAGMHMFRE